MKHALIFTFFSVSLGFSAFAQTEQGSKFVGGTFGISTASLSNGNNSSTFELSPRFGYFIKDQWAVGSGLGLTVTSNGDTDVFFSISPFTRYYFPIVENQFFIFGEAGFGLGFGDDRTRFSIYGSPGFAFFPTERWAIELGFNLISLSIEDPEGGNNNTTRFNFGTSTLSPSLGVYFFF